MADNLKERIQKIKERRSQLHEKSWEVNPFNCLCDERCKPFIANAPSDIDALIAEIERFDKEVREVLEGLAVSTIDGICWCAEYPSDLRFGKHADGCQSARSLYEKLKV